MKSILTLVSVAMLLFNTAMGGTINDKNGNIKFATFESQEYQRLTALKGESLLKQLLPLNESDNFKKVSESLDAVGMTHEKFQQFYGQIPVEFGLFTLHYKNGKATSAAGEYIIVDESCPKMPTISVRSALELAKKHVGATKYMWEDDEMEEFVKRDMEDEAATFYPEADLVYVKDFLGGNEKARLAFKFDIYAQLPLSRGDVYVDVTTGKILCVNNKIHHADEIGTAETKYNGVKEIKGFYNPSDSLFYLAENSNRKCETYDMKRSVNYNTAKLFKDNDNNWTAAEYDNIAKDNAALDVHYGTEKAWDYWKTIHNRNSYDDRGGKLKSYVHYSTNYDNAFWDGQRLTYGDGSGDFFDAVTSLDVCGHEIGHAICSKTANLYNFGEPGSLSEGFSDFWAACMEYYNGRTQDQIWKLGEDIDRRPGHSALRVMNNPKVEKQPDTYLGQYWEIEQHVICGMFNYWFYLLSMGGSGVNDNRNNYNVTGIGIEKVEKIAYRAEKEYMTPLNTIIEAREITLQSAIDLYGANSPEVKSVNDAWYAVGVGEPCLVDLNVESWKFEHIEISENTATIYIENNPEIDAELVIQLIIADDYLTGNDTIGIFKTLFGTGDTFRMVGLDKCTRYLVIFRPLCASGITIETILVTHFKTLGCICEPVRDLRVRNYTPYIVFVHMSDADPADSIELSYRKVGTNNWIKDMYKNDVGIFDEQFVIDNLTPNTEYELKVRYLCDVAQSNSESIFFTTQNATCGASESFKLINTTQTEAEFSLLPFSGTVVDKVKYKKVLDTEYKEIEIAFGAEYFDLEELTPNSNYMAFVESICFDSTVYPTGTIFFKTKSFSCATGNEVVLLEDPKPTEAKLKWFTQGLATEYELYYEEESGTSATINTGIDTFRTITGLKSNKYYSAKVRPKCDGTWRRWSDNLYFKTPLSSGLNFSSADIISLGIYPNPSNGNVKLVSNKSFPNQLIRIADIMGKTVFEKTINLEKDYPTELDLNQLSQGTYFIYTDFEGNKVANKLVIIR